MNKTASTHHPIHPLLAERWSNRAFEDRPVDDADLEALLEAARWAPSAFNAQPWRFVYGKRGSQTFDRIAACLVEGNAWAKEAGALFLTCARTRYEHNDKANPYARHDLGLAVMSLVLEATHRGLGVHQMAGFDAAQAQQSFQVPEPFEAVTTIALGHVGPPESLSEPLRQREIAPRDRKAAGELFFTGDWPSAAQ